MEATDLVRSLNGLRASDLPLVGGKGANLGELVHAGFPVPPGFCVTTAAFRRALQGVPDASALYAQLDALGPDDLSGARRVSGAWQRAWRTQPVPPEIAQAILTAWRVLGRDAPDHDLACAVRSSATAEDLPDASFAGQQDSFLNVRGESALLEAVRGCWASLFNDRAIAYRQQQGVAHRSVDLAVVVQRLVASEVSGILFTADPLSGERAVSSIDASFGLGEALVSGLVSADTYRVDRRARRLLQRRVSDKLIAIEAAPSGGVQRVDLQGARRAGSALSDAHLLELSDLGARIEAHFGAPQDIEWARAYGRWWVLQARPITTLYPLPEPRPPDDLLHAYISFSHFQVMTDAMPPLAASVWRVVFPFGHPAGATENPLLCTAGGRLYVDVSYALRHPLLRRVLPRAMRENGDALIGAALADLAARPEFGRGPQVNLARAVHGLGPVVLGAVRRVLRPDSHAAARGLAWIDRRVHQVDVRLTAAPDLPGRLEVALNELRQLLPGAGELTPEIVAGLLADALLRQLLGTRAEQADVAALTRGLSGNVTTEMDLALGDLADLARNHPEVATRLRDVSLTTRARLDVLALPGGPAFLSAWRTFLALYGARGPGEIDLSRPRWHEHPASLLGMLTGQLAGLEPLGHRAHAERLAAAVPVAEQRVVRALGPARGWLAGRLLRAARAHLPLREHLKFLIVRIFDLIKPVLLEGGVTLSARGQLDHPGDVWFLTLPELRAALTHPGAALHAQVAARRAAFGWDARRTPPRAMTSDGEVISAAHAHGQAPSAALVGQAVSAGVVEGVVRVVLDPEREILRPGEILVAPFTDPGWTPLFVAAAGLVTEVGGLMTHGSLVAREYGLPAVVGVDGATRRLRTGQRVRVNGDLGYVEVLEENETGTASTPSAGPGPLTTVGK